MKSKTPLLPDKFVPYLYQYFVLYLFYNNYIRGTESNDDFIAMRGLLGDDEPEFEDYYMAPEEPPAPIEVDIHELVVTPSRNEDGTINYEVHIYDPNGDEIYPESRIEMEDTRTGERPFLHITPMGLFSYLRIDGDTIRIDIGDTINEAGTLREIEYEILIEQQDSKDANPTLRIRQISATELQKEKEEEEEEAAPCQNRFSALADDDSDDEDDDSDDDGSGDGRGDDSDDDGRGDGRVDSPSDADMNHHETHLIGECQ